MTLTGDYDEVGAAILIHGGGMTKKELIQLAVKNCERTDCIMLYTGMQCLNLGTGPFFNKSGDEIQVTEPDPTHTFMCVTCGRIFNV